MDTESPNTESLVRVDEVESGASSGAVIRLPSGYAVDVSARPERLDIKAPDGTICLTITLAPEGPRVEISAASLSVESRGEIALRAETLTLAARRDLSLSAGEDAAITAGGALQTKAFEQHIEATHGDIRVQANDDVRIDGERVRLNSPDAAPLRRLERERASLSVPRVAAPDGDNDKEGAP